MTKFLLLVLLICTVLGAPLKQQDADFLGKEMLRALEIEDFEWAQELIEAGANPNAKDVNDRTGLHWTAIHGRPHLAEMLLDKGAQVNAVEDGGFMPLHWASYYGSLLTVELLLKRGAQVNTRTFLETPLHFCAWGNHLEICKALVAAGADLNALNKFNHTPYQVAVGEGHDQVAEYLSKAALLTNK